MSESATSTRASSGTLFPLIGIYLVSRGIGLTREIAVAVLFGTTATADVLAASFIVATVVGTIIGEGVYVGSLRWLRQDDSILGKAERYSLLVRSHLTAAPYVTVAFAAAAPFVVVLLLGGVHSPGVSLPMLLAPSVGAAVVSSSINARLTLDGRYALMNAVTILYSLGAVLPVGLLVAVGSDVPPEALAAGWSLGNCAAAAVLYARARPARSASPRAARAMLPFAVFGQGISASVASSLAPLQSLTDRAVAARLETGSVAALAYADRLFLLPIGFVLAAVGPMVLRHFADESRSWAVASTTAVERVRQLVLVAIPVSIAFAAAGPVLVTTVFQFGEFGSRSSRITVAALDGLAVGIPAVAVSLVLFRAMQAVTPGSRVIVVAVTAVCLNAVATVAGAAGLGLFGVTLATSLVAYLILQLQAVYLLRALDVGAGIFHISVSIPIFAAGMAVLAIVSAEHGGWLSDEGRLVLLAALFAASAASAFVAQTAGEG
jgi:putative peptidoglycan lipid II flippase